eukprot:scaffold231954_cov18-Prasinocladus_malaysianus.AAC.1
MPPAIPICTKTTTCTRVHSGVDGVGLARAVLGHDDVVLGLGGDRLADDGVEGVAPVDLPRQVALPGAERAAGLRGRLK